MSQPKNILSIFKVHGRQSRHFFDGSSTSILKQWAFILCFGIIATIAAIWWSTARFSYWSNIEARIVSEDVPGASYDQRAVRSILRDYEDKAERSERIINSLVATQTKATLSKEGENEKDSEIGEESLIELSTTTASSTEKKIPQ